MKSKIKLISILVIAFITVSCATSKNITGNEVQNHDVASQIDIIPQTSIEGVWKLVYSSLLVENLPENVNLYKIIVDGRFFWYKTYAETEDEYEYEYERYIDISTGAGGTYSISDKKYIEDVEHVVPEMEGYKGYEFVSNYAISGNMLKIKGSISNSEVVYEEVFEKVSTVTNASGIMGVWKLLNSNLNAVAKNDLTRYKMIVDDRFMSYEVDKHGIIQTRNMMGGTITFDSAYQEIVTHCIPKMHDWRGSLSTYKSTISKFQSGEDILKTEGANTCIDRWFTEVFEKVHNINHYKIVIEGVEPTIIKSINVQ